MWKRTLVGGLVLLGFGGAARAADVTVQPMAGSGFVVTDNTGGSQRLKVLENGQVFLGGLVTSPPIKTQPLCYDVTTGQVGACPGVPGAATRFVDNGDGTVTDNTTGLMWEKKTGTVGAFVDCSTMTCSNPHDVNNGYDWCQDANNDFACDNTGPYSNNPPDGGAFFDFLARVNGTLCAATAPISPPYPPYTCGGLGGHTDWRLPTLAELQTIVDTTATGCGTGNPCINSAFGPTAPFNYWSSSTNAGIPTNAWFVDFITGYSLNNIKASNLYVRAVRGGL